MLSTTIRLVARNVARLPTSTATTSSSPSVVRLLSPLASSLLSSTTTTTATARRTYISRAHPKPITEYPAPEAFEKVLDQIARRKKIKAIRWKRNAKQRVKKNKPDDGGPYRPGDETVEISINLNVDPRKPGQSLRGSLSLPHGTGKRVNVVVFTDDADLAQKAKTMGALHVGGESLMDQIVNGEIPVDSFQRSLATSDVMGVLTKRLARVLGPRGLMPNPKVGTVAPPEQLLELLPTQLAGKEVQYRTEKEGIIHLPVGRGSFGKENLLENTGAIMNKVYEIRPESYGKAKKKGGKKKGGGGSSETYVISAYVSSTFGKGFKIDLRTLDPSSAFFLSEVEP